MIVAYILLFAILAYSGYFVGQVYAGLKLIKQEEALYDIAEPTVSDILSLDGIDDAELYPGQERYRILDIETGEVL